jgi:hypothetical protein
MGYLSKYMPRNDYSFFILPHPYVLGGWASLGNHCLCSTTIYRITAAQVYSYARPCCFFVCSAERIRSSCKTFVIAGALAHAFYRLWKKGKYDTRK